MLELQEKKLKIPTTEAQKIKTLPPKQFQMCKSQHRKKQQKPTPPLRISIPA
jgi:hypothetical protein